MVESRLVKINRLLIFAVAFTLPFSLIVSLKVFGLWIFSSLFLYDKERIKQSKHKIYLALIVVWLAFYLVGVLYSENFDEVFYELSIKIYLFIVPFIMVWTNSLYKRYFDKILSFHILGSVTAYLLCFVIAVVRSLHFQDGTVAFVPQIDSSEGFWLSIVSHGNWFFYTEFSSLLHPSYAAINSNFAIAALVFLKRNPYKLNLSSLTQRLIKGVNFYVIFMLLVLSVVEYSSRTNYIALGFLMFFIVLTSSLKYKYALSLFVLGISVALMFVNPRVRGTVEAIYKEEASHSELKAFNRYHVWKAGFEVAKKNFWFGTGTGDLQKELNKIYKREGQTRPLSRNMNSHNEFLQQWARLGIFNLWIFVLIFGYALIVALYCRRRLLFYFLILLFINFIFEAMLERVAGVMFFSFFFNLLLLMDFNRDELPRISF